MSIPILTSERLVLRPFEESDAAAFYELFSDPSVARFVIYQPLQSLDEAKAMLKKQYLDTYEKENCFNYAICFKNDPKPIGYVNVNQDDSYDLGYGLHPAYWHQGIITEAAQMVVARAKQAGLPYLTATHDILNPNSGKVMEKLGMRYQYSYEEEWKPNLIVTFRMYQINFTKEPDFVYRKYWNRYPHHIEKL